MTAERAAAYLAAHRRALETALRNDVLSAGQDARTMREIARRLRAGEAIPLYAPGASGALGAERLARSHGRRRLAAQAALAALEELEELG